MIERKIQDLTESEFLNWIKENFAGNHIEVAGVIVSSQRNSLQEVESCADRLLKKHKDFLLMRKSNQLKTEYLG
jgi:ribonuclease I